VNDPEVRAVRERVSATADPNLAEDAVRVGVELKNGGRISKHVDHAIGNLARPMTDRDLEQKFQDQAARVLPAQQVADLIALCWRAGELGDMRELLDAAVPRG
jgi:2-methylcitrate dehydratase PrpD